MRRLIQKITIFGFILQILAVSIGPTTAHALDQILASCLDSVAGYSTLCKTSITAPNTEVTFKVTKPDGSVLRFPGITDVEGVAKTDLNYFHTKTAGTYKVGAYFAGYDEPEDLEESSFRIFPDTVSPSASTVSGDKLTATANNRDTIYISVLLKDQYGNPIKDHSVDLISSRLEDTIAPVATSLTDADGKVSFKVTSKSAGVSTYIAKDTTVSGVTVQERVKISWHAATSSAPSVTTTSTSSNFLKADLLGTPAAFGGPASTFNITVPDKVQINSPFDVTVQVLDSTGSPALAYRGTVFFSSPTDANADLPLPNEGYAFKGTDENASHTFAKAVTFKQSGTQRLVVTDVDNPQLESEKFITVVNQLDNSGSGNSNGNKSITLVSPSDGSTYGEGKIEIIGKIKPATITTFKVYDGQVELGEDETDEEGNFTFEAKGLSDGKHSFKVAAFDSSEVKTAESPEVIVFVDTKSAILQELEFDPANTIQAKSAVKVRLVSEPKLRTVRVIVDGVASDLTEEINTPGTYTGTITAPAKEGEYPVKVSLINGFDKESTPSTNKKLVITKGAASADLRITNLKATAGSKDNSVDLTWDISDTSQVKGYTIAYDTNPITLSKQVSSGDTSPKYSVENLEAGKTYYFAVSAIDQNNAAGPQSDIIPGSVKAAATSIENLKGQSGDGKVTFTWDKVNNAAVVKYRFQYGLRSGEYLESVVTRDNQTNWYIPDLINGVAYYFKLEALDANNQVVLASEEISAIPGNGDTRPSAPTCSPADVGNLRILTRGKERILAWDSQASVTNYRVYSGTQEEVFNLPTRDVQEPFFVIPFLDKSVPNYYFAVKALCNTGTELHESANFSNILKVQSGPEVWLILALSGVGVILLRRLRKKRSET